MYCLYIIDMRLVHFVILQGLILIIGITYAGENSSGVCVRVRVGGKFD